MATSKLHSIEELELSHRMAMFDMIYLSQGIKSWSILTNGVDSTYTIVFTSQRGELFEVLLQEKEISCITTAEFNSLLLERLKQSIIKKFIENEEDVKENIIKELSA